LFPHIEHRAQMACDPGLNGGKWAKGPSDCAALGMEAISRTQGGETKTEFGGFTE
jgi:hypothetical protein